MRRGRTPRVNDAQVEVIDGDDAKSENVGSPEAVRKALQTLTTVYVRSPVLEEAMPSLRGVGETVGVKETADATRAIIEQSPHRPVKAAATFTLGTILLRNPEGEKGARAEARGLFERVRKEYAETPYAGEADRYLFELENLQIGRAAPDFEATDQEGKPFKLSDYRGKVVVLDFWGFW
jgi:hypothetical protein